MKFINITNILKFLMILILPFVIFLTLLHTLGFDESYLNEKIPQYASQYNSRVLILHESVLNFIQGKSNELPDDFTEREKQHLLDVKKLAQISIIVLYGLIFLFAVLLVLSLSVLKVNNLIMNFIGKVLLFGGLLTLILGFALLLLISSNFSVTFEWFHRLFFEKGSYVFEPSKEIIVTIYPETLFMDIGIRISKWFFILSILIIVLGAILIFKSKSKKNKN